MNRGAVLLKDLMLLNLQSFTKNKGKVPVHGREGIWGEWRSI